MCVSRPLLCQRFWPRGAIHCASFDKIQEITSAGSENSRVKIHTPVSHINVESDVAWPAVSSQSRKFAEGQGPSVSKADRGSYPATV